jgi:rhamnosyltransferase subunit B
VPNVVSRSVPGDEGGLPPGLEAHLDAGDPPVLVTLGTAAASNADRVITALVTILDRLGVRAVFLAGRASKTHPALRDRADAWSFAPLSPVLARCRAVVHAGGHGTTAAVLSAGRPAVVLPQVFDQQWHSERVEALGAGLLVTRWPGRPAAVEAAVRRVLREPSFTAAAVELAAGLATEHGPGAAADAIEVRLAAAAVA